jgi:hypothetical protein
MTDGRFAAEQDSVEANQPTLPEMEQWIDVHSCNAFVAESHFVSRS